MATEPSTYTNGWTAESIVPVSLNDARLGSRVISTPAAQPTASGSSLPPAVAAAVPGLNFGGVTGSALSPLQAQLLGLLTGSSTGYLAAPALTASAVQPGALFSLAGDNLFQNPALGDAYSNVAKSVADAQSLGNTYARRQLARGDMATENYYNALANYRPGGAGGSGDLLNQLYNANAQSRKDTSSLLSNPYLTIASGWGSSGLPKF